MNGVAQKHPMSCGLACVAYVAGVPYDELAKDEPMQKLNQIGFYCPELTKILAQLGHNYDWKKLAEDERDSEFNIGDIVFIEPNTTHRYGHFLAKSEQGWMDPWLSLTTTSPNALQAISGFRQTLPGRAEYLIYKTGSR